MGVLRAAARQLVVMTFAQAAILLLLGAGTVAPPAQTSAGPPSSCPAPFSYYEKVARLTFFFVPGAIGAISLAAAVAWNPEAAGGLGDAASAATPARVRALVMVAGVLSATSAALVMAAAFYMLQIKASLLACMTESFVAAAYASYLLVGLLVAGVYGHLAKIAITTD